MIRLKPARDRLYVRQRAVERWSSFSAAGSEGMFRGLRLLDEVLLGPEHPLDPPGGSGLELLTAVVDGSLIREGGTGGWRRQGAGDFRLAAGGPAGQRARNESATDPVRVLHLGLLPRGLAGRHDPEQRRFPRADLEGVWRRIACPDGRDGALALDSDAAVYASVLLGGQVLVHELLPGRGAWLHVLRGRVKVPGLDLAAGDAATFEGEACISLTAREPAELLAIDLG